MFKRLIISELNKWAANEVHKPLVLRGARQVGKTSSVNIFSQNFDQFISLNLENAKHKALFESGEDFENIVNAIFYLANKKRNVGRTLIFIDEIQNSSEAIRLLRYFYELTPNLYVIAAGSLLETLLNSGISFPVGRVEYLAVRPCSFLEFLEAIGETATLELIENQKFPDFAHQNMLALFQTYTVIGGMPEIVQKYSKTKDVVALQPTFRSIVAGYKDDVEKYASNPSMVQHIRHIINAGFPFASQRIKFEQFARSDYRSREMGEAFRTLEKTMLLDLIYPSASREMPLLANFRKSPRLLWLDTGLVNYFAGVQHEVFMNTDIQAAWKGKIAEHIVAQELMAYNTDVLYKRFFWTREEKNAQAEIDFIIPYKQYLIPIEVKAGLSGTLKSMHLFMEEAKHDMAVRVSSLPFSIEIVKLKTKNYRLFNIPFYAVSQIEKILMANE